MGIVLRGATVVNADAACLADLRICGEKIAAIGPDLVQAGDQVIDVAGCTLFPGGSTRTPILIWMSAAR